MRGKSEKMNTTLRKAKILRQNSTEAERVFWQEVRNRRLAYKFYRQFPIDHYIADFVCPELKLVIEIDGGQHNDSLADQERTKSLNATGYKVIRFWNNDVLKNIEGVILFLTEAMDKRKKELQQPWTTPSPKPSPHQYGERALQENL